MNIAERNGDERRKYKDRSTASGWVMDPGTLIEKSGACRRASITDRRTRVDLRKAIDNIYQDGPRALVVSRVRSTAAQCPVCDAGLEF